MPYGDKTAGKVSKGRVNVSGSFVLLSANGTSNLSNRRHIRLYNRGGPGWTIALAYANRNNNPAGDFTTPTDHVKNCELLAGGEKLTLALSDSIQVYGKFLAKAGETEASTNVIVTEFA